MVHKKIAAVAMIAVAASFAPASFGLAEDKPAAITEIAPAGGLKELPRNQTVVLGWGVAGGSSLGVTNP